jgi:hypothetical protein
MLFRNCTDAIEDSPIEGVFIRAQKWIPPWIGWIQPTSSLFEEYYFLEYNAV